MNLFGGRRGGATANNRRCGGPGQQCSHGQCPSAAAAAAAAGAGGVPSYPAGGALGQTHDGSSIISSNSNSTRVTQPGMEMMPTMQQQQPSGLDGLPMGGGTGAGILGMENIEEHLKGAPADVLAAAERLSLISPMMLAAEGGGMAGGGVMDMDDMAGVVSTAPGAESTDTGVLSVSSEGCLASTFFCFILADWLADMTDKSKRARMIAYKMLFFS